MEKDISVFPKEMQERLTKLREKIQNQKINEWNWREIKKEFTDIWTLDRIKNMTLEQYTDTETQYSFTYWLEHVLHWLGSIRWWSSIKFWIYKTANGIYEASSYWKKEGDSDEKVFIKIKKSIIDIITKIKDINPFNIENVDLDFKYIFQWKIAFLYDDSDFLTPYYSYNKLYEYIGNNNDNIKQIQLYKEIYKKLMWENPYQRMIKIADDSYYFGIFQISKNNENTKKNFDFLRNIYPADNNENIKLENKKFFTWNSDKFKKMSSWDIVFFIEPDESILIAKIFHDTRYKLELKDKYCLLIEIDSEKQKEKLNEWKIDIDNQLSLEEYKNKEFIIFEIINDKKINTHQNNAWKNVWAGSFTYVKDLNDDRLKYILESIKEYTIFKDENIEEIITKKEYLDDFNKVDIYIDIHKNIPIWWNKFQNSYNLVENFAIDRFLNIENDNIDVFYILFSIARNNYSYKEQIYILTYLVAKYIEQNPWIQESCILEKFWILPEFNEYHKDVKNFFTNKRIDWNYLYIATNVDLIKVKIQNIYDSIFDNYWEKLERKIWEKDQKSFTIGIIGKWWKWKTAIVNLIKKELESQENKNYEENRVIKFYEIDVWKWYAPIGNMGKDKLGLIKYFFSSLLSDFSKEKLEWLQIIKRMQTFLDIQFLKNNLYHDILVSNYYKITKWHISIAVIYTLLACIQSYGLSIFIQILNQKYNITQFLAFGNSFFSEVLLYIMQLIFGLSIFGIFLYLGWIFWQKLFSLAYKTPIFNQQISDLNIAQDFKEKLEKIISSENRLNVIILDNLDRISPEQLIDCIDLTKTILDLKNTVYIIPIDQSVLFMALELKYGKKFFHINDYLDKIINYPIFLINPYIDSWISENKKLSEIINEDLIRLYEKKDENGEPVISKKIDNIFNSYLVDTLVGRGIPRKIHIFKDVQKHYQKIYKYWIRYIGREDMQKLFLFFVVLRYVDYIFFACLQENPSVFKNFVSIYNHRNGDIDQIYKDLFEKCKNNNIAFNFSITDIDTIKKIFEIFFTINERDELLEMKIEKISLYMEKVNQL